MNSTWKVIFGIMVFVTAISLVYGFVQQKIAKETRRYTEEQSAMADQYKAEADKANLEAARQAKIAADAHERLQECMQKK